MVTKKDRQSPDVIVTVAISRNDPSGAIDNGSVMNVRNRGTSEPWRSSPPLCNPRTILHKRNGGGIPGINRGRDRRHTGVIEGTGSPFLNEVKCLLNVPFD